MMLIECLKLVKGNATLSNSFSDELEEWLILENEKAEKFNPPNSQQTFNFPNL
jgi:hypothetical protein